MPASWLWRPAALPDRALRRQRAGPAGGCGAPVKTSSRFWRRTRSHGLAPARLGHRFGARYQAELVQHQQIIAAGGVLNDFAALDAVDVDLVGLEGPAGGRHGPHDAARADSRRELAQVRAPQYHPVHHLVAVDDLLQDLVAQVGKCGPPCRDDVPHRRMAAGLPDAEVRELVIHQILDSVKVAAIPDTFQEAADDRAVVLLNSHETPPLLLVPPKPR